MGTRRRSGIISRFCAAGLALGLLMLAGCTDDEPDPPPPTSSTPSSPTSTEPTDSPSPDPESAEDFIRRWVEVHTAMQNTGATKEFRQLSRGCDACEALADRIDKIYAAGGFVETTGWSVESVKRIGHSPVGPLFRVRVDSGPTDYSESATAPPQHLSGGTTDQRFQLARRGDSWTVAGLSQFAS